MPDISLPETFVDGNPFVADKWNADLYQTPNLLAPGKLSLYETGNGKLDLDNFDPAFQVRSYHVRPWQTWYADGGGEVRAADYYQSAWGTEKVYYGIAGAQWTWRAPHDYKYALLSASMFASIWRQRGESTGVGTWADAPEISAQLYLDGQPLAHSLRNFPETIYYSATAASYGDGYDFSWAREERNTRYLNLFQPCFEGGNDSDGTTQLLAGWHRFGLAIYVAVNKGTEDVNLDGGGGIFGRGYFSATDRVRAFVRNVSVVHLL